MIMTIALSTDEKIQLARRLKKSLEKQLDDIDGVYLDIQHRGDAVLWSYGYFHSQIPIIAGDSSEKILLEFPQYIEHEDSSYSTIPSMKCAVDIWERIQKYLETNGEKQQHPCRNPTYYFRNGIPE